MHSSVAPLEIASYGGTSSLKHLAPLALGTDNIDSDAFYLHTLQ
jgi:hypothetical protein